MAERLLAQGEHCLGIRLAGTLLGGRKAAASLLQTSLRLRPPALVHIQLRQHHERVIPVRSVASDSNSTYHFLEPCPCPVGITSICGYQRACEATEYGKLRVSHFCRFPLRLCAGEGGRSQLAAHALHVGN